MIRIGGHRWLVEWHWPPGPSIVTAGSLRLSVEGSELSVSLSSQEARELATAILTSVTR